MDLGVVRLPSAVGPQHAMPVLRYDTFDKNLVVDNASSSVRAEQFVLDIEPGDFRIHYDGKPFDLSPMASAHWSVLTFWGSSNQMNVTMRWTENGEPHEHKQTVFL